MMLTFEQLQAFKAIIQAGTFRRAAQDLFLTEPAISQRISHLEKALGVELFRRGNNRRMLRLTNLGEDVLHFTDEVLNMLEQLQMKIAAINDLPQQESITIACSSNAAQYLVSSLLTAYNDRHPCARVNLILNTLNDKVGTLVRDGEVEFGIIVDTGMNRGLHTVPLIHDRLVLIAAHNYPISPKLGQTAADIRQCPFVLSPPSSHIRHMTEQWAASLHLKLNVLVETNSLDFLKQAVTHGLGLAVVQETAVASELRDGYFKIVSVQGLPLDWQWSLILDGQRTLSCAAQAFLNIVREEDWRKYLPAMPAHQTYH